MTFIANRDFRLWVEEMRERDVLVMPEDKLAALCKEVLDSYEAQMAGWPDFEPVLAGWRARLAELTDDLSSPRSR